MKVIQFEFRCSSSITGCAILVEKLICLRFPNEKEWKNGVYFYVPVAKANQQIFKRQYCILCASVSMFSVYSTTLPCLQHILHQPLCSNSEKWPCEGFLEPNPVPDQNRCCSHVRERNQLHPATTNSTVNPALLVFTDLTPRSSVSL